MNISEFIDEMTRARDSWIICKELRGYGPDIPTVRYAMGNMIPTGFEPYGSYGDNHRDLSLAYVTPIPCRPVDDRSRTPMSANDLIIMAIMEIDSGRTSDDAELWAAHSGIKTGVAVDSVELSDDGFRIEIGVKFS